MSDTFRTLTDGKAVAELIRDGIKVRLIDEGEGVNGKFDPENPEDVPLLRFDVFTSGDLDVGSGHFDHADEDGEWFREEGGGCCTQLPATMNEDEKRQALEVLMDPIRSFLVDGVGDGKVYQRLSWASLESLRDGRVTFGRWVVRNYVVRDGHHEVDG